jgi:Sec-independent protein translocase protein TatA
MDILGIGLPEIVFILLVVVIIFGPKDLEKMGKTIGSGLFRFFNSEAFRNLRRIGELPAELVRKAGLDEFRTTVSSTKITTPQNPPAGHALPLDSENPEATESENRIEPPAHKGDKPV